MFALMPQVSSCHRESEARDDTFQRNPEMKHRITRKHKENQQNLKLKHRNTRTTEWQSAKKQIRRGYIIETGKVVEEHVA